MMTTPEPEVRSQRKTEMTGGAFWLPQSFCLVSSSDDCKGNSNDCVLRVLADVSLPATIPEFQILSSAPSLHPFNPSGTIGSDRLRMPVAWKMALPTAGAIATIGVSPAPAGGRSFLSTKTVSSTGTSLKRGTR